MQDLKLNETIGFSPESLNKYAKKFQEVYSDENTTEESFYTAFQLFLEDYFDERIGFQVKSFRIQKGTKSKPDFSILYNDIPILLIEAKKPRSNIKNWIESDSKNRIKSQIIRYREDYGASVPIILTDFIDLHLVNRPSDNNLNSIQIEKSACLLEIQRNSWRFSYDSLPQIESLFHVATRNIIINIASIKGMISLLAKHAGNLRDAIYNVYVNSSNSNSKRKSSKNLDSNKTNDQNMVRFLKTIQGNFTTTIFKDYKEDTDLLFADLISQTIIYGCFGAWLQYCSEGNSPKTFSVSFVGKYLPYGSFIRQLFLDASGKISPIIEQEYISKIEMVFQSTKFDVVVSKIDNLMTMFYSQFLQQYDKHTAKARGVVYTPNEIVDFMIKGIDYFLETLFYKQGGVINTDPRSLTHPKSSVDKYFDYNSHYDKMIVNFLEPAAGTMAFPCGLLKFARHKFQNIYLNQPALSTMNFKDWVQNFFFENVHAFEILMAPYVLGHIRIQMTIQELLNESIESKSAIDFEDNKIFQKLNLHLMNTLMNPENLDQYLMDENIKREISIGLELRDRKKIYIIFGNPPYNVSTQNDSDWIRSLIQDYKVDLNEKNLKILSDDYVKFLRFSQWKINQSGLGMVAFITNNNYLDGAVFKIMRKSLMETFNEIYIVDLHGNMRKNESGNPFNIKVGVSIIFLLRTDENYDAKKFINGFNIDGFDKDTNSDGLKTTSSKSIKNYSQNFELKKKFLQDFKNHKFGCHIHYLDVPEAQLDEKYWKLAQPFEESIFQNVAITPDFYFKPKDIDSELNYSCFISIEKLFNLPPKSGIMTGRDSLVSNPDPKLLDENLDLFFEKDFKQLEKLGVKIKETKSWNIKQAFLRTTKDNAKKSICLYNYRGFDRRYLIYDNALVEGCRLGYLDLISKENPAISVTRSIRSEHYNHTLITFNPPEKCFLAVKDSSYIFNLMQDPKSDKYNLKKPELGFKFNSKQLFYYIYGVLWSKSYRARYNEQLKDHFPRIPFPRSSNELHNQEVFLEMASKGLELADIHLRNSSSINPLEFSMSKNCDFRVIKPIYDVDEQKIYFGSNVKNKESNAWIGNISEDIWNFELGSSKQIKSWLESRKFKQESLNSKKKQKRHKGLFRGLNKEEINELLSICSVIKETLKILPKLDEIYQLIDPL